MTKADLVNAIAEKADFSRKDAEKALSSVVEVISESLENGEKVQIVGFGTFEVRDRKAKDAMNPSTKEIIHVEARKSPVFKAGKTLKDRVVAAHS